MNETVYYLILDCLVGEERGRKVLSLHIYRAGNLMYSYSESVSDYLEITAKTVMDWYTSKGITIHYINYA